MPVPAKVALPPNPLVSEVLEYVSKKRTKAEKIKALQDFDSPELKSILIWNFDETIVNMLPDGVPPYKPNEAPKGTEHTNLSHEHKILYNFLKGGNDQLRPMKREELFMQLLEGLHSEEAEVVCLTKDRNLTSKYKVTKEVVSEAYPDIVWGNRGG
jgi:hypothetical protein